MIYNIAMKYKDTNKFITVVKGYDNRPLRFTELRYAEAAARDKNQLQNEFDYIVIKQEEDEYV